MQRHACIDSLRKEHLTWRSSCCTVDDEAGPPTRTPRAPHNLHNIIWTKTTGTMLKEEAASKENPTKPHLTAHKGR